MVDELVNEIQRLKDVINSYKGIIATYQQKNYDLSQEKKTMKKMKKMESIGQRIPNKKNGEFGKKFKSPPNPNEFDDVPF